MNSPTQSASDVRSQPVQQRSNERVKALLDAAAAIIDEQGIDAVTSTSVAYRSGSYVGVLYRYFLNIDALLRTLARRNLDLYMTRVREGSDMTPDHPWSSWDLTLDSYVELCRNEPSFRVLGFGDRLTEKFLSSDEPNVEFITRQFADIVAETHSVPVTKDMLFHLQIATSMGLALMTEAFRHDAAGDKAIIEEARRVIGDYLRASIPLS
ncbi:MAG: HTH-type transcriptional repressor Bm3R1 [Cellulomonadaceae bacterium TMED98]|nr:MAG: HTH-type transcriptional repressor Bm3R1 [Cellulomonadaceae bacterium TMED98]